MNSNNEKKKNPGKILTPPNPDLFRIGNLELKLHQDYVLAAIAMPELESNEGPIIEPNKPLPRLWRAWVVALGPGQRLRKADFTYNPGIFIGNYIYFDVSSGVFFDLNNISFVFVSMRDVEMVVSI